jgi:hypothetical protein
VIPQTQSRTGKNGRCFQACLASILEIKEADVPEFATDDLFLSQTQDFLKQFNLYYIQVDIDSPGLKQAFKNGPVYHTIEGKSPRGHLHAVVGLNGQMAWDPHPQDGTGRGLVRVDCFGILCAR